MKYTVPWCPIIEKYMDGELSGAAWQDLLVIVADARAELMTIEHWQRAADRYIAAGIIVELGLMEMER